MTGQTASMGCEYVLSNIDDCNSDSIQLHPVKVNNCLRVTNKPFTSTRQDTPVYSRLIAISNKYGYTIAGTPSGISVFWTADAEDTLVNGWHPNGTKPIDLTKRHEVSVGKVTHIVLSADELLVFVALATGSILVFSASELLHGPDALPFGKIKRKEGIRDIRPSPFEKSSLVAILTLSGLVWIVDIAEEEKKMITSKKDAKVTCISWSPDGEQIICGDVKGMLTQRTPMDGVAQRVIHPAISKKHPESFTVLAVNWIEPYTFMAIYGKLPPGEFMYGYGGGGDGLIDNDDESGNFQTAAYVITQTSKQAPMHWKYIENPCEASEFLKRYPGFHFAGISGWGKNALHLQFLASAGSAEVMTIAHCLPGILKGGSANGNTPDWNVLDTDPFRAQLPMAVVNIDESNTAPLGMAVDFTGTRMLSSLSTEEESTEPMPPQPILWILTTDGCLVGYYIYNDIEIESGQQCSGMAKNVQALPGAAVAPAAPTAASISTAPVQGAPTFVSVPESSTPDKKEPTLTATPTLTVPAKMAPAPAASPESTAPVQGVPATVCAIASINGGPFSATVPFGDKVAESTSAKSSTRSESRAPAKKDVSASSILAETTASGSAETKPVKEMAAVATSVSMQAQMSSETKTRDTKQVSPMPASPEPASPKKTIACESILNPSALEPSKLPASNSGSDSVANKSPVVAEKPALLAEAPVKHDDPAKKSLDVEQAEARKRADDSQKQVNDERCALQDEKEKQEAKEKHAEKEQRCQTMKEKRQAEKEKRQAEKEKRQAEKEKRQAEKEKRQAENDRRAKEQRAKEQRAKEREECRQAEEQKHCEEEERCAEEKRLAEKKQRAKARKEYLQLLEQKCRDQKERRAKKERQDEEEKQCKKEERRQRRDERHRFARSLWLDDLRRAQMDRYQMSILQSRISTQPAYNAVLSPPEIDKLVAKLAPATAHPDPLENGDASAWESFANVFAEALSQAHNGHEGRCALLDERLATMSRVDDRRTETRRVLVSGDNSTSTTVLREKSQYLRQQIKTLAANDKYAASLLGAGTFGALSDTFDLLVNSIAGLLIKNSDVLDRVSRELEGMDTTNLTADSRTNGDGNPEPEPAPESSEGDMQPLSEVEPVSDYDGEPDIESELDEFHDALDYFAWAIPDENIVASAVSAVAHAPPAPGVAITTYVTLVPAGDSGAASVPAPTDASRVTSNYTASVAIDKETDAAAVAAAVQSPPAPSRSFKYLAWLSLLNPDKEVLGDAPETSELSADTDGVVDAAATVPASIVSNMEAAEPVLPHINSAADKSSAEDEIVSVTAVEGNDTEDSANAAVHEKDGNAKVTDDNGDITQTSKVDEPVSEDTLQLFDVSEAKLPSINNGTAEQTMDNIATEADVEGAPPSDDSELLSHPSSMDGAGRVSQSDLRAESAPTAAVGMGDILPSPANTNPQEFDERSNEGEVSSITNVTTPPETLLTLPTSTSELFRQSFGLGQKSSGPSSKMMTPVFRVGLFGNFGESFKSSTTAASTTQNTSGLPNAFASSVDKRILPVFGSKLGKPVFGLDSMSQAKNIGKTAISAPTRPLTNMSSEPGAASSPSTKPPAKIKNLQLAQNAVGTFIAAQFNTRSFTELQSNTKSKAAKNTDNIDDSVRRMIEDSDCESDQEAYSGDESDW